MNTRFDYEHIRSHDIPGWQAQWYNLLDGRFVVENNELVEDRNAPIFRLGLAVAEVAAAIGHVGYTRREIEWYGGQPERYTLFDGQYVQVAGWSEVHAARQLATAVEEKLLEIDLTVRAKAAEPFDYNGRKYYPDVESIQGQFAGLSLLPADYSIEWKTADKVGLKNIYVTLDKAGIAGLAMALQSFRAGLWNAGDTLKKQLKEFPDLASVQALDILKRFP